MERNEPHEEGGEVEIVFFDLETTMPSRGRRGIQILEFGAIVVCPRTVTELESYSTLIRPKDVSLVAGWSRIHGITPNAVAGAPSFEQVADRIYGILNGRIWAGHNIQRFDCVRVREAFDEIHKPAPMPLAIVDSLVVLTQKFGRRAGNMKMATLASYFGLGPQKHRSLDDVRMNLEVLKQSATVLFLESTLPKILGNKWNSFSRVTTRSRRQGKAQSQAQASEKSSHVFSCANATVGKVIGMRRMFKRDGTNSASKISKHSSSLIR